jgi:nucleoside-diphosphate-sugar epimerase
MTGGSGFIRSNLMQELEKRGREVRVCDLLHSAKAHFIRCGVSGGCVRLSIPAGLLAYLHV